jgi:hypothetical protein
VELLPVGSDDAAFLFAIADQEPHPQDAAAGWFHDVCDPSGEAGLDCRLGCERKYD